MIRQLVIAVPTFKRPDGLARLLQSLAVQDLPPDGPRVQLLVVDNDPAGSAKAIIDRGLQGALPLTYRVEPKPGVSAARNALLDALPPEADGVAFIDDDEWAPAGWLRELLAAMAATNADVVCGPMWSIYPEGTSRWLLRGRFFERIRFADLTPIAFGWTCNSLVKLAPVRAQGLRFDERLGFSGGEDTLFFRILRRAGGRFVWAERAGVYDPLPPERVRFSYYLRRQFWKGAIERRCDKLEGAGLKRAFFRFSQGTAFAIAGFAGVLPSYFFGPRANEFFWRCLARGLGILSAFANFEARDYARRHGMS